MSMVINSNIMSLTAQRNLTLSQNDQNSAMERLTSGKRINSAADDAAGLAISSRMTSQIQGLNQAVRNANDGASMIQTAEGALEESTNILQRMRELSIQSGNGTYSDGDRSKMNAEVKQLVSELDRISETTSFNGQNVLDGSLGKVSLQVGSEANQTIDLSIAKMDSASLGLGSTSSDLSGAVMTAIDIQDGDVLINGSALGAHDSTSQNIDDLISNISNNVEGVTATAYNVFEATNNASGVLTAGDSFTITVGSTDGSADVAYAVGSSTAGDGITSSNLTEMVDLINKATGGAVTANISEDTGRLVLSNSTGGTITLDNVDNTPIANATGFADTDSQLGSLALTSANGDAVTITTGADGTDADLKSLGFRRVEAQGVVISEELGSGEQAAVLAVNDLKINGVAVSAVAADGSSVNTLAEKVTNINALSDETGVTASIVAEKSYTQDFSDRQELTIDVSGNTFVAADDFSVNGVVVTVASAATNPTATELAAAINTADTGVEAYVDDSDKLHLGSDGPITLGGGLLANGAVGDFADTAAVDIEGGSVDLGGVVGTAVSTVAAAALAPATDGSIKINNTEVALTDLSSLDQIVTDINVSQGDTGVSASIDENGALKLASSSGITLEAGNTNGYSTGKVIGVNFADAANDGSLTNDTVTISPRIKLDSANDQPVSIEVTSNGVAATGLSNMNTAASSLATGSSISSIDISTAAGAQKAIGSIDQALETINSTRGDLGAISNRLDFTVNNLSSVSENASAARSRIMDADFAVESANLSRAQVLQQAGTAMLAQANAAPQQVLSLLQ
jgi:flagellin